MGATPVLAALEVTTTSLMVREKAGLHGSGSQRASRAPLCLCFMFCVVYDSC